MRPFKCFQRCGTSHLLRSYSAITGSTLLYKVRLVQYYMFYGTASSASHIAPVWVRCKQIKVLGSEHKQHISPSQALDFYVTDFPWDDTVTDILAMTSLATLCSIVNILINIVLRIIGFDPGSLSWHEGKVIATWLLVLSVVCFYWRMQHLRLLFKHQIYFFQRFFHTTATKFAAVEKLATGTLDVSRFLGLPVFSVKFIQSQACATCGAIAVCFQQVGSILRLLLPADYHDCKAVHCEQYAGPLIARQQNHGPRNGFAHDFKERPEILTLCSNGLQFFLIVRFCYLPMRMRIDIAHCFKEENTVVITFRLFRVSPSCPQQVPMVIVEAGCLSEQHTLLETTTSNMPTLTSIQFMILWTTNRLYSRTVPNLISLGTVTKMDKCFLGFPVDGEEAFQTFQRGIPNASVLMSTFEDTPCGAVQMYPQKDILAFSAGLHSWVYALQQVLLFFILMVLFSFCVDALALDQLSTIQEFSVDEDDAPLKAGQLSSFFSLLESVQSFAPVSSRIIQYKAIVVDDQIAATQFFPVTKLLAVLRDVQLTKDTVLKSLVVWGPRQLCLQQVALSGALSLTQSWPMSQHIFPGIVLPTSVNVLVASQAMSVDAATVQYQASGAKTTQRTNSSTQNLQAPGLLSYTQRTSYLVLSGFCLDSWCYGCWLGVSSCICLVSYGEVIKFVVEGVTKGSAVALSDSHAILTVTSFFFIGQTWDNVVGPQFFGVHCLVYHCCGQHSVTFIPATKNDDFGQAWTYIWPIAGLI